jgi:hypothetical protein
MESKGKYGTYAYLQLIREIDRHIRWMPESGIGYQKKLLKCAEFWWLHKGAIPAASIAILLNVERTDLIKLINGQIQERGAYIR